MKTKVKYILILLLVIISLIASLILSFTPIPNSCSILGGCDIVHNCCYNYTFGIQNSYYGIVIFTVLSVLVYSQIKRHTNKKRNIIHLAIILGSIVSLYFIYLQQFVIKAYCQYCLITDFSILIMLGIIIIKWKD